MTTPAANPPPRPGKPVRVMPPPKAAPDPRLSALSLLDEAAHRLRAAPAGTLSIYYASTLPFVLAVLFFWADMSRSADAADREAVLALGLALLFVVMKTGHAVFASRLRAQFAGGTPPRWTFGRLARVGFVQATWQPTSLFVLPAAVALAFPLGWAYAFYHNLSVCGDGEPSARSPVARAWRHTVARAGQNHRALGVLWGMELLAWLALMVTMYAVPNLLKTFTGEDNAFTRGGGFGLLFNSTFLAVSVALVYLAFNPFAKTFYALRCFYADAQASGEDLLSELRALPPVGRTDKTAAPAVDPARPAAALSPAMRAVLAGALLAAFPVSAQAADAPAPTPAARGSENVSPGTMDRSMREVLNRREFAWRNPRAATPPPLAEDSRPGVIARFFKDLGDRIAEWFRTLRRWLGSDKEPSAAPPRSESGSGGGGLDLRLILYILVALCVVGLAVLLYQTWRTRRSARALAGKAVAGTPAATPDLADESVLADQLPEDEWLALARRLLAQGEHRLALRAFYLSTLSGLGGRGLLGIARHKSNRDYQGELRRRARDRTGLQETFARLVGRFERVWYGSYPADDGLLADFQNDRERLTAELPHAGHPSLKKSATKGAKTQKGFGKLPSQPPSLFPFAFLRFFAAKTLLSMPTATPAARRRRVPWGALALVGVLAVFAAGVVRLFDLRFDVGDIYPPYSTLRSDPLGAKAFFASVDALPGLRAERSLRPLSTLGTEPLRPADYDNGERDFTCFYLGADAREWPYLLDTADAERLETIMRRGGRVVITFQPTHVEPTAESLAHARAEHAPPDSGDVHDLEGSRRQAKKSRMPDLTVRWGIDFRRHPVRPSSRHTDDTHDIPVPKLPTDADPAEYATPDPSLEGRTGPDAAFARDREAVPWHSVVDFRTDTIPALLVRWHRLYERHGRPVIVSRPFGTAGGELILVGDTYFLSNEGLRNDPSPALLAALVGGGRRLLFDESHLDLLEKPGVMTLARRYRLQGALAALGLLAALFVWRNVVSLVPARAVASPDGPDAVLGHAASSGYLNLLRRSVRPRDLPGVCLAQWEQGTAASRQTVPAGALERVRAVLAGETALPARKRSSVAAVYRAMCEAAGRKAGRKTG